MYIKIGEQIQILRKRRGYTQESLAEIVGVSVTHVGHIEQGRRKPRIDLLRKIADALGVRVKDLIPF